MTKPHSASPNSRTIAVINGPNLNLLGSREPSLYGGNTLAQIEADLQRRATQNGLSLISFQSNSEGDLINYIQTTATTCDIALVNAGALTHTSIGLRDALLGVKLPFIEVHLSNVYAREPFRHKSYLSDIALGVIAGFGPHSYTLALDAACTYLAKKET